MAYYQALTPIHLETRIETAFPQSYLIALESLTPIHLETRIETLI